MTTITQLITRTLELDEAATPGPYEATRNKAFQWEVSSNGSYLSFDMYESEARMFAEYRTAAPLLAKECQRLQDLHRPRDTRKGEWPEEGQEIMMWDGHYWKAGWLGTLPQSGCHWLPAPPSPEGD